MNLGMQENVLGFRKVAEYVGLSVKTVISYHHYRKEYEPWSPKLIPHIQVRT